MKNMPHAVKPLFAIVSRLGLCGAAVGLLGAGLTFGCSTTAGTSQAVQDPPDLQPPPPRPAAEPEPEAAESGPDIKTPGPDFGFIPNAIGIVPPGRLYVESSFEFDHDGDDRAYRFPLLLRIGVAEDWEVRAQGWVVQRAEDSTDSVTGSGPVQLGCKHRLSRGGGRFLDPAFGFEVELLLPISSGGFDHDRVEPAAYINVDHTVSQNGVFTWNVGALVPVDEDDDPFLQGFVAAAYSHFVSPGVQLYGTGSLAYPTSRDGGGVVSVLGAGGYWYVSRRVVLFLGYNAGLTPESPTGSGVVGASFAF